MDISTYTKQYKSMLGDESMSNFLKGDIAIEIYKVHEEEKKEKGSSDIVKKFLQETNESKELFSQLKWVSSAFPEQAVRKLPGVTWSHYRAAAGTTDPVEWLKKAHDNRWPTHKLISEIQEAKSDKKIESGLECIICNKNCEKDTAVTVSYQKHRNILCGVVCAIDYLNNQKTPAS